MAPSARRMEGQLKGGLIGAALLGLPMMWLAHEWNKYDENGGSTSPLLVGLVAGSLGFVVGVLIAGPEDRP